MPRAEARLEIYLIDEFCVDRERTVGVPNKFVLDAFSTENGMDNERTLVQVPQRAFAFAGGAGSSLVNQTIQNYVNNPFRTP